MTIRDLASARGFSKAYIGMLEKGINPTTNKPVVLCVFYCTGRYQLQSGRAVILSISVRKIKKKPSTAEGIFLDVFQKQIISYLGEVLGLSWQDIDFAAKKINLIGELKHWQA